MQSVPAPRIRLRNITAEATCPTCLDEAVVWFAGAAAPCPRCERGFRLEFGEGDPEKPRQRPPWPDGFWSGREIPSEMLVDVNQADEVFVSAAELRESLVRDEMPPWLREAIDSLISVRERRAA